MSTHARLLDAYDDSQAWHDTLTRLPEEQQDVYFTPEYVRMHLFEPGAKASLFVYDDDEDVWVRPFVMQPIPSDWIGVEGLFDLDVAYGYGGPVCTASRPSFLREAHNAFNTWCVESGVVAEFVRFHPLLQNQRWDEGRVEVLLDRKTVSTEIAAKSEVMDEISSNARNMIRKSRKLDVAVEAVEAAEVMPAFVSMYKQNMDYVDADSYYYFTPDYFETLAQLTDEEGWMLTAEHEGAFIAGALFLKGERFLHYHLSAADYSKRVTGTTNAILFEAVKRGNAAGLTRLHLGGGTTDDEDDSLLKFKKSMGTDLHEFYIGKQVHQPEAYEQLKSAWAAQFPESNEKYGNRVLCYRYRNAS